MDTHPEGACSHATRSDPRVADAPLTPLADSTVAICRRIIERLPQRSIPSSVQLEPGQETHWKLRALCDRAASTDDDEPYGYRWPASGLTDDDMRRMNIISNMTKIPCNKLLHLAVGSFFDETRSLMSQLLQVHEKNGKPLETLLSQDFDIRHFVPIRSSKHLKPQGLAQPPHNRVEDSKPSIPEHRDDTVLAAESSATPGGVSDPPASSSRSSRASTEAPTDATGQRLDQLIVELQALRDEIRVVWQSVDELREWGDHALRNPPETQSPPLRIWSLASDPMADDFGERINAIPEEVMQRLRAELPAGKP